MPRRNLAFLVGVNASPLLEMAGFQLSINGRFWVSTEGKLLDVTDPAFFAKAAAL